MQNGHRQSLESTVSEKNLTLHAFTPSIFIGSKFAPYGKDGCTGMKGPDDQSDNSAMSTSASTGRRRGNMVNRVNSSDSQCFFEGRYNYV